MRHLIAVIRCFKSFFVPTTEQTLYIYIKFLRYLLFSDVMETVFPIHQSHHALYSYLIKVVILTVVTCGTAPCSNSFQFPLDQFLHVINLDFELYAVGFQKRGQSDEIFFRYFNVNWLKKMAGFFPEVNLYVKETSVVSEEIIENAYIVIKNKLFIIFNFYLP